MRRTLLLACSALISLPQSAVAADCLEEIRGLFIGGPMDPFLRPNWHQVTILVHPDGSTSPMSDVLWDGPVKSRNCYPGGCAMSIGSQSWTAPGPDGPWTEGTDPYSGVDPETFARQTTERHAASISAAECLGEVDLDGRPMLAYRFISRTEPNEFGAWWGGDHSLWLDPATHHPVRIELAGFHGSWAPEPSKDLQVTTTEIDETIRLVPPN
ncbi:hypothetical protein ACSBLW_17540 [Thioclava sp. FR2]|uniref:hypothetical protein n=1 Tax=Thioclava sp. FR2 TaxID=3445780 RepID=UPI003EC0484B